MYNCWMLVVMLGGMLWTSAEETPSEEDSAIIFPADITSENEKRNNHNIIRFGKRPSYDFAIPEKRDSERRQHSRLYFGKRSDPHIDDLLQYLQRNQEKDSWKRGHNIMRFGKRAANNQMLRFGKSVDLDSVLEPLMDDDKRSHQMMYFGKREEEPKRASHSLLHFGKRFSGEELDSPYELERRAPHQIIHFGKRAEGDGKRGGHTMIHFGKRSGDLFEDPYDKRAHSMIHFGKRSIPEDFFNEKRGPHSMIHFGKRDNDEEDIEARIPMETIAKKYHAVLHFGKRDNEPKRAHSMIHFGKRDNFKGSHSMVHFGKRSAAEVTRMPPELTQGNKSEDQKHLMRQKREAEFPEDGLENSLPNYMMNERVGAFPFDNLVDLYPYYFTDDQNFNEYPPYRSASAQHEFIHFGKR